MLLQTTASGTSAQPAWSRRTQALLLLGVAIAFVIFRWVQRLEPWNSDDMELFHFSVEAAAGKHWLFGAAQGSAAAAGSPLPHAAFRVGLLPFTVPAVLAFGANATAYYLVPLLFSLVGFGIVYWVLLRNFGARVALVFAVIHVAWPFELEHASVLLTDLPAAVAALASLCLLDASAGRTPRARFACALFAGLAGWETYLLRNNGLVLLAPAYLVFLWSRATRIPTLCAGALILLGVLGQQAFLMHRGFGWGEDWRSVRADFAEYAKFLPIYSWPTFLLRQFTYQLSTFGRGPTGALAALLVAASLGLHLLLLRHELLLRNERRRLLLSIAVFGLFTWLVYSFSIYERVPGGVRAMVPVNFRFIQPFTYSSLMVWAWAWSGLEARRSAQPGRSAVPQRSAVLLRWASVALPLVLLTFAYTASAFHLPPTYREGATRRLARALEQQIARAEPPAVITGTSWSLQVPRVFCCEDPALRVEWRELEPAELAAPSSRALVLRDLPRELELARYFAPDRRRAYQADLAQLEQRLWQRYELAYVDGKYALFAQPGTGAPTLDVPRDATTVPASGPPGGSLLTAAECALSEPDADGARTLLPNQEGRRRTACEASWLEDGLVLASPGVATIAGSGFVLRVSAEYEPPLALAIEVVQSSDDGLRRQRSSLSPGTSYVPVPLQPGARELFVVYRITTRGALDAGGVRVRPAVWRPHQLSGGEQGAFASPEGSAAP